MESRISREEELRQENIRLREMLSNANVTFPVAWALSRTEEAILRALLQHDLVSTEHVVEAGRTTTGSVRVHVHRLRKKVLSHGLAVETVHRRGWRLIDRETWRAKLAASNEGVN